MSISIADGRLHRYWPQRNLTLFEYLPSGEPVGSNLIKSNTLIFIGGLYDSFLSVPYVPFLASYIHQCPNWTLMEIQLSSSLLGWATGDLHRDVEEIGKAVEYVQDRVTNSSPHSSMADQVGKVVLMGHSTGSQDVLHYLYHKSDQDRPPIDGAVLQAAVSDREGLAMMHEDDPNAQQAYNECLRISLDNEVDILQGKMCTLPPELTKAVGWPRGHVSCKRFLSLTSPFSPVRPELDDLFSSDLSDETLSKTFGSVGRTGVLKSKDDYAPLLLILLSADDEYTPKTVDKEKLMKRWQTALDDGEAGLTPYSAVIGEASHNVKEQLPQVDLTERVLRYLDQVVGDVPMATFLKLGQDYVGIDRQDRGNRHET